MFRFAMRIFGLRRKALNQFENIKMEQNIADFIVSKSLDEYFYLL